MLIVILAIGILLIVLDLKCDPEGEPFFAFLGISIGLIAVIAAVIVTSCLIDLRPIDAKIAMHQEENAIIEEQLTATIENYLSHEKAVFESTTPDSAITLISLYPELKSDQLIESQIQTYIDNSSRIRALKEKKLNKSIYRWWLYFGK